VTRVRLRDLSLLSALVACLLLGSAGVASAQFGGQPGGMGPGMGPQPGDEQKEEGPAEAAPEDEAESPSDLAPMGGYPGQQRKITRIVTFDGYFRLRTDFFHKLNLGQGYHTEQGGGGLRAPPFPLPLECQTMAVPCSFNNFGGGNTRFRLEPTINVTDQVRVHTQVDILDNTIMGSTPDSLVLANDPGVRTGRAPLGVLSTTQDPPEIGRNGYLSSIRAKRAWGEVDTEFGFLGFGRMPWHFGRGMTYNNGACIDCEGGTTVDRVLARAQVYGHQVALAWDWGSSGYHMAMTDLGRRDLEGPPLDLSQEDDVFQLMASIALLDDDQRFRERVGYGELVVNYGLQLVYRQQTNEAQSVMPLPPPTGGGAVATMAGDGALTREQLNGSIVPVDALVFQPSVWFKLGWKALTIELEGTAVLGSIDNAGPLFAENTADKSLTLRQFGWVLATELNLYRNAFFLGFETGGATGDQAEDINSHLNYRWKLVRQPPGDNELNDFKFNPDYQVDQILFRRILGTVTNAVYFKPSLTYWLDLVETRQVGLSAAAIYSLAPEQISTPGNSLSYGIELDLGISYRNPGDGFYGGVTYGVLWPLGALDRGVGAATSGTGAFTATQDAETAQVLRLFLGIRF
jgi:uncharacterized protein (TIGR04551 family)